MKSSHKTIFIIFVSFILSSLVDEYLLITRGIELFTYHIHTIFVAICLFIWCKQHGRENGHTQLRMYPLFCALIGFIGVPVYAYKFYGLKHGTVLLSKAIVALIVTVVVSIGATTLFSTFYL
jgi:hypothetical protein|tara:strand:- start:1016 stop:1381 length:366 start_codon:yes stop_codon:yes gene_type:complete